MFRRLALLAVALSSTPLFAQTSIWSGNGGNGNWTNPNNWDVVPISGINTEIEFHGSLQTNTVQNTASPFDLNRLSQHFSATNFSVSGFPLRFVASSGSATLETNSSNGRLRLNVPVEFVAPTTISMNTNNFQGAELYLSGRLTGSAPVTTAQQISMMVIESQNNTQWSSPLTIVQLSLIQLGAHNAIWRNTAVTLDGSPSVLISGTTTAAGYGTIDAGYNQQIGSVSGTGQLLVGTTNSTSTVLAGFLNTSTTLSGPASFAGFNPGSHFGKVGTGTLTVTGANAALNMGVSFRDGSFVLQGVSGSVVNSDNNPNVTVPGPLNVYAGAQLRMNNEVAVNVSNNGRGRLADNGALRLSGGTLRLDGHASLVTLENLGDLTPFAGQGQVIVNRQPGAEATLNFASVNEATLVRGGQVAFIAAAGVENAVTFTAAPSLTNGLIPWGLAQTNYVNDPGSASNTIAPDALAELGPNGVRPLTTFTDNTFPGGTFNVRVNTGLILGGPSSANSLTLDAGANLTLSGGLTLTSGALMNRAPGAAVGGSGSISTAGRLYLNTSESFLINCGVSGTHLSKGGNGNLTLGGLIALGTNPIVSVNAGTLTFGTSSSVTTASGTVTFQVSRGATLANVPTINGTLRGNGTVTGPVTIAAGGTISGSSLASGLANGNSPGTLTLTGPLTLQSGSRIHTIITSIFSSQYTQSLIAGTTLDLTGISTSNPVIITLQSLALSNESAADVYDLDPIDEFVIPIGTFPGGISGFSPDRFAIDLSQFTNAPIGNYGTRVTGNTLEVTYVVPEPALIGLVPLLFLVRRIRR